MPLATQQLGVWEAGLSEEAALFLLSDKGEKRGGGENSTGSALLKNKEEEGGREAKGPLLTQTEAGLTGVGGVLHQPPSPPPPTGSLLLRNGCISRPISLLSTTL